MVQVAREKPEYYILYHHLLKKSVEEAVFVSPLFKSFILVPVHLDAYLMCSQAYNTLFVPIFVEIMLGNLERNL